MNGVKQGQGTMIFDNKDKYVGQLLNNERHGAGNYYMASGDRIEGIGEDEEQSRKVITY